LNKKSILANTIIGIQLLNKGSVIMAKNNSTKKPKAASDPTSPNYAKGITSNANQNSPYGKDEPSTKTHLK